MWKYIATPLIGAVIGYVTNWIAVKMLFRPRKEIRVFGKRLPFTPGVIPRGQGRLARAVGNVVETQLLTPEYLGEKLLSKESEEEFKKMLGIAKEFDVKVTLLGFKEYGRGQEFAPYKYDNWLEIVKPFLNNGNISIDTALAGEFSDLLEKEKASLQFMASNINAISNLVEQISKILGKYTFYNNFESGWNYKCEKMHIKITIDNYKSPTDKNIKLEIMQVDGSNTWKQSYVNDEQLLKFLKNNKKFLIQIKNKTNFDAKSVPIEQLQNLNLNVSDDDDIWKNWGKDFLKIDKKKIACENPNLFIRLPLEKRIMIQSCLDPRDNIEKYFNSN